MKILGLKFLDPKELKLSPSNVRKIELTRKTLNSLIDSIDEFGGIIEPLVITENKEIVCGRRRWEASKILGLKQIPCLIVSFEPRYNNKPEVEAKIASFIENKIYQILTDDEETININELRDEKLTLQQLERLLGISKTTLEYISARSKTPPILQISEKTEEKKKEKKEEQIQTTLRETSEDRTKRELKQQYSDLSKKFPRKWRVLRVLLNKEPYKNDLNEAAKLLKFTTIAPLRMLEDIRQDLQYNCKPDLDYRIEMAKNINNIVLTQMRFYKTVRERISKYCRKNQLDFYDWLNRGAMYLIDIGYK